MRIYLRLAELARSKRGWTLRRLSDELRMDYQNIVNWNTGRSIPHLATLITIARALRCTLDELIHSEQAGRSILNSETMTDSFPKSKLQINPYPATKPNHQRGQSLKKNKSTENLHL